MLPWLVLQQSTKCCVLLPKLSEKLDMSFGQSGSASWRRQKSCSAVPFSDSLTRALLKLSPVYTLGRLGQTWPTVPKRLRRRRGSFCQPRNGSCPVKCQFPVVVLAYGQELLLKLIWFLDLAVAFPCPKQPVCQVWGRCWANWANLPVSMSSDR